MGIRSWLTRPEGDEAPLINAAKRLGILLGPPVAIIAIITFVTQVGGDDPPPGDTTNSEAAGTSQSTATTETAPSSPTTSSAATSSTERTTTSEATTSTTEATPVVPAVIGIDTTDATGIVESTGIRVAAVQPLPTDVDPEGLVVRVNPAAGNEADEVTLIVSAPPRLVQDRVAQIERKVEIFDSVFLDFDVVTGVDDVTDLTVEADFSTRAVEARLGAVAGIVGGDERVPDCGSTVRVMVEAGLGPEELPPTDPPTPWLCLLTDPDRGLVVHARIVAVDAERRSVEIEYLIEG